MAFKLRNRSALMRIEYYKKPASTAFAAESLVTTADGTSTGTFIPMTSATATVLGVLEKTIASTDTDYATATMVPLLIDEYALHYVDLTDASNVNVSASSVKIVFITKYISATKILGRIVKWAGFTVA